MEAIIAIIIMFWVITSAAGALGKNQQGKKLNRPRGGIPGMPTFGGPDNPTPSYDRSKDRDVYEMEKSYDSEPSARTEAMSGPMDTRSGSAYPQDEPFRSDRANMPYDPVSPHGVVSQPESRGPRDLTTEPIGGDMLMQGQIGSIDHEESAQTSQPLLDRQHIVNGIIWSEILGKPRSRRGGLR